MNKKGANMASAQMRLLPPVRNTVMVGDDHADARELLTHVMQRRDDGLRVESFGLPSQAVGWAARNAADLVLLDFMMPEMDGISLVEVLRALPGYEHVPIVMLTANDNRKVRYEALDAGATDFLVKPIDVRECTARC